MIKESSIDEVKAAADTNIVDIVQTFLKLKREANAIKKNYQDYLNIKTNLILGINNWISSASKHKELTKEIEEMEIIKLDLK